MNAKLTAAAVLFTTLFAGSAFADRPRYSPPAPEPVPTYAAPAYPGAYAPPVVTVAYDDDDGDRGDRGGRWGRERWQHEQWEHFQREQAERCRAEDAYLARERADYIARYGWDPRAMGWLDQRQADERAQFQASQQMREQEFRNRMAWQERRHGHGRHFHEADWD